VQLWQRGPVGGVQGSPPLNQKPKAQNVGVIVPPTPISTTDPGMWVCGVWYVHTRAIY
jgi:hypothetical protein